MSRSSLVIDVDDNDGTFEVYVHGDGEARLLAENLLTLVEALRADDEYGNKRPKVLQ